MNYSRKNTRCGNYEMVDKAIYNWFFGKRSQNIPINGITIKVKALEFAKAFCVTKFKASDCWWNNWKKRYNLSISINFEYFYKVFEHIFCSRMQGTCIPSPSRGGSRAAATSKIEHFVIIVNS